MNMRACALLASLALAGCSTSYSIQPVTQAQQTIRYDRGAGTLMEDKANGSMQITSLGVNDDGRLMFGMAAFNKSGKPMNFGMENVTAFQPPHLDLRTYNRDQLAHEAKVKAGWQAALTVLAGAAAAYSANQNAYSTTNGYVSTPRGIATFSATTYDPAAAAVGTAAATAATGYTLVSIKHNMDNTLDHLNGQILQTTTVDPGQSYGGEVVMDMPKGKTDLKQVEVQANWNGEIYNFGFVVRKQ